MKNVQKSSHMPNTILSKVNDPQVGPNLTQGTSSSLQSWYEPKRSLLSLIELTQLKLCKNIFKFSMIWCTNWLFQASALPESKSAIFLRQNHRQTIIFKELFLDFDFFIISVLWRTKKRRAPTTPPTTTRASGPARRLRRAGPMLERPARRFW